MSGELRIRPLLPGADDAACLNVVNLVAAEFPDRTPIARDELEARRKEPDFDPHAQFIAELDEQAVGIGSGELNPLDIERVGWANVNVLSEFRRRHIGTALAEAVRQSLRAHGAKKLRAAAREENPAGNAFLRSLGWEARRTESWMLRTLEHLPSGVGENTEVRIREATLNDDDLRMTTELINETFKEDWGQVPHTVEKRRQRAAEYARQGAIMQTIVAMLEDRPVGHIQPFISTRKIAALKVQRGLLLGLGVLKPFRQQGIATAGVSSS